MACWQGRKARGGYSVRSPSLPLSWSNTELYKEDKQVRHGTTKSSWRLKKLFYNSLLLWKKTWLCSGAFTACFCVICHCYCWAASRSLSWNWIWIWLQHWSCLLNYCLVAQFPISWLIFSILHVLCKVGICDLIVRALDYKSCLNTGNLKLALW